MLVWIIENISCIINNRKVSPHGASYLIYSFKGLVDMTPPVVSNCPDTVSVSVPFGTQNTPISWIAPTATDDSGNVNVVPSHNPGFSFPIGLSVVTYTFADRTGNEASCTFLIFVTEDGKFAMLLLLCMTEFLLRVVTNVAVNFRFISFFLLTIVFQLTVMLTILHQLSMIVLTTLFSILTSTMVR